MTANATAAARPLTGLMEGLSEREARARRREAGEGNSLHARAGRSYAAIIWQATFVPVNLVLFGVSVVLVALGLPMPTLLAIAMVALFGIFMSLPVARWFFEIEPIPLGDAVGLGLVALVWALAIFAARRLGIADRLASAVSLVARPGARRRDR